jgi:hypothetical protein
MNNLFIFAFLSIISPALWAFDVSLTVSTCVSGYCSPQPVNTPLAGTGNRAIDRALYNSYRYELDLSYQNELERIQERIRQVAEERRQLEGLSTESYQELLTQMQSQIQLPQLPNNLVSPERRRQMNPLPTQEIQQSAVNQALDHIWREIESQSPHRVADALSELWESLSPAAGTPSFMASEIESQREFLETELTLSQVVNGDGLINGAHVEPYDMGLISQPSTSAGRLTRSLFNQHIANQSLVRAKCLSDNLPPQQCQDFEDAVGLVNLQLLLMDRLASQARPGREFESAPFKALSIALKNQIALLRGFAHGAVNAYEGMLALLSDIPGTAAGVAKALYHYDSTYRAIQEGISERWEEFWQGDSEKRSFILGQLGFEVVATLVPISKVTSLKNLTQASRSATRVLERINEPIFRSVSQGIVHTADEARALVEAVRNTWRANPNISYSSAIHRHRDYFSHWNPSHRHIATESAAVANLEFKQPAYLRGTMTYTYSSPQPQHFLRVHDVDNKSGRWLVRQQDIAGLTPLEVKNKLNIPNIPTYFSEVAVPPGVKLRKGRIGPNRYGTGSGTMQFQVIKKEDVGLIDFYNTNIIEGVVP